jgi:hypothetical protein
MTVLTEWGPEDFARALERAAEGVVEADGARLNSQQVRRPIDAAPRHPEHPQRAQLKTVHFLGTTFTDDVTFDGAIADGIANFDLATFNGHASFNGTTFARANFAAIFESSGFALHRPAAAHACWT